MIINLKTKIEELIQAFHANTEQLNAAITAVIEEFKAPAAQDAYKAEYITAMIAKGVAQAKKDHHTVDVLLNTKLKSVIEEAKKKVLPELYKSPDKASDYEMKVANALKFLEIESEELTDDAAFLILKDFASDYEKMKLFKKVIGKKIDLVDANGNTTFPKTFGKFNQIEVNANTFDELDALANILFITEKFDGQTTIIYGESYSLIADGYEEMSAEDDVLALAALIDEEAAKVDADIIEN